MATADKLITVAENVPKVYHAGQLNVIENTSTLKKSASGSAILIDDISPVTHEMGVRVRGKNLLNLSNRDIITNPYSLNTDVRNFNGNQLFVGITANNYFITPNIVSYSIGETITVTANQAAYGLGYDVAVKPNTKYVFSSIITNGEIRVGLYNKDGIFSRMISNVSAFTTNSTEYWAVIVLKQLSGNESIEASFSNIQLELGTTATAYTPYVLDLTAVKVSRCGKNLFDKSIPYSNYDIDDVSVGGYACLRWFVGKGTPVTISIKAPTEEFKGCYMFITFSYKATTDSFSITKHKWLIFNNKVDKTTWTDTSNDGYVSLVMTELTYTNFINQDIQIELGSTATEYEPYITPTEYTPTADGTVNGVTNLYPNTTLMTDTDGVIIDCEYYKDIDKAYNKLSAEMALSGGE